MLTGTVEVRMGSDTVCTLLSVSPLIRGTAAALAFAIHFVHDYKQLIAVEM